MKRLWIGMSLALVACGTEPPPAEPGPQDPDTFVAQDSVRILADLRILSHDSLEGRRTGEAGNAMARDFILGSFQEVGLQEPPGGFIRPFEFSGRRDTTQLSHGSNVVGYVPGTDPTLGAIVVTAHFDHVGIRNGEVYNGADDNASGTVALMSMARYLVRNPPRHTTVFAALDAEEMGLHGARSFVQDGWPEEIALNINLDMVSRSDSLLWAVGTAHYPELRPILERVEGRGPVRLRFGHDERGGEGMQDWTGSSDQMAFHAQGIPFIYFGVDDHPDYHRPTDDFDRIDPAFFLNAIRTVLAGTLALDAELPVSRVADPDSSRDREGGGGVD
jgi:Zn-dependent M28 family amino/carboxypeptidase